MQTEFLETNTGGIDKAATLLAAGQTVAFATETVYGLGADARNDKAVARIFKAKDRPLINPLIVHFANIDLVREVIEIPPIAEPLLALWPGPLTLVLPRKPQSGLSDLVTAGLDTVAVRIPAHPSARALLAAFDGPVAAPSANLSGKVSATSAAHVMTGLSGRIAAVLDGGPCAVGVESTILGFQGNTVILLRAGGVPVERIEEITGQALAAPDHKSITAPGQFASHYAPDVNVRTNATAPLANEAWLGFGSHPRSAPGLNLSAAGNLTEAAANLFDALRKMDAICKGNGLDGFAVAPIPNAGLGLAINDRLNRASATRR